MNENFDRPCKGFVSGPKSSVVFKSTESRVKQQAEELISFICSLTDDCNEDYTLTLLTEDEQDIFVLDHKC